MANKLDSITEALNDVMRQNRAIIITLPATMSWEDYEKELDKVKDWAAVMNFKVPNFPTGIKKGDRCYILHKGVVKGWMEITGFTEQPFTCTTTGKSWKGKFIQRSGPFHYIDKDIRMKGFQGFRYFNEKLLSDKQEETQEA